jgi:hypothetical protein
MSEPEEPPARSDPADQLERVEAEAARQARIAQQERERRTDAEAREEQLREQLRRAEQEAVYQRQLAEAEQRRRIEAEARATVTAATTTSPLSRAGAPRVQQPAPARRATPGASRLARPSRERSRVWLIAAVPVVLVVGVIVVALVGPGDRVGIDATGSPVAFVRGVLVASYSGDAGRACAQFSASALAQLGGAQRCRSAVSTSPADVAIARRAHYWPQVAGDRAVVLTSATGELFLDRSQVDLVRNGGRWKISCVGYCNGPTP